MSGDPQKRIAFLREYLAGVQSMDPERAMRAAAPGYLWYDGMVAEPITKDQFANYLLGWEDRMKAIGGTGRYEVSDELSADQNGHILRWAWWRFVGTDVGGSALLKVGDEGVIYEKIAYFKPVDAADV
ncbi:hypothetical protein [Defluviimonas sp. WL0050]|nr:hypothetical protein [Defluviimonas sp. WL0050]